MVAGRRLKLDRRRLGRWAARLLLGLATLLLILTASLLARPTRNLWLKAAVHLAEGRVPGRLEGHWSWPRLGRLEGRNLVWTVPGPGDDGPDTLAAVPEFSLDLDLGALRRHDLRITQLLVEASLLDVPLIQITLAPAGVGGQAAPDSVAVPAAVPFLRPGSVPGLPSAALETVDLAVQRLVLPEGVTARALRLNAAASMAAGEIPHLRVADLAGRAAGGPNPRWSAELTDLRLAAGYDPQTRAVTLDSLAARLPLVTAVLDTLQLQAGPLALTAAGDWRQDRWQGRAGLTFQAGVPASLQNPVPGLTWHRCGGLLQVSATGTADSLRLNADLDLDPEGDLQQGRLVAAMQASLGAAPELVAVRVDTLALRWRDTALSGQGRWNGQEIAATAHAELPNLQLPQLLAPGLLPGVTGSLSLDASAAGPVDDPVIAARTRVSAQVASLWALPQVAALADTLLPSTFPRQEFQAAAFDLQAQATGTLTELAVEARLDLGRTPWLDRGLVAGRALVAPRSRALGAVHLDTLAVALRQSEVMLSGTLDTLQADLRGRLAVGNADLLHLWAPEVLPEADLALTTTLSACGPWRNPRITADLSGRFQDPQFHVPDLQATLRSSPDSLLATARAGGGLQLGAALLDSLVFRWEGQPDPAATLPPGRFTLQAWAPLGSARLQGSAQGDSVRTVIMDTLAVTTAGQLVTSVFPARLSQGPGPRDLVLENLRLQGDLGTLAVDGRFSASGWEAAAATDLLLTREWLDTVFPSPFWSAGGGLDVSLTGTAALSSAASDARGEPGFHGRSVLQLVPRSQDPPARLGLGFHLAGGDSAALLADLDLSIGPTHLLGGTLAVPGRIDPATGRWLPGQGSSGQLDVPEQEMPLAFLNRFLPPEVGLDGSLTVGAGLALAQADSVAPAGGLPVGDVKGMVRARDLKVSLPNRSRVTLAGQVDLTGALIDPRLAGQITVENGFFRLPEAQRALHPASGASILWSAAQAAGAAADSTLLQAWLAEGSLQAAAPAYLPDLDLTVDIPGGFLITGYGLDTELAGRIQVSRGWDPQGLPAPVLRGRVRVVDGTLHALNHVFEVERGELDLEGRIPPNPSLNLVLVTEVDGTVIRIKVTGTALEPKVDLESEPEMVQADIMAFLLFGRPLNDLDNDQRGNLREQPTAAQQLRQNLQGLVLVFGTAGLQNRVSEKVGVDQLQLGSDTAGGSALVLGKFLNPRLLLKYNQSLERSGTYFMTLEYTVSRAFKLLSTYGQGEEASSLELRWQRRY